jgi:integrase
VARLPRNAKFETRAARVRLASQPRAYWRQIAQGLFIGYRKGKTAGVWIARHLVDSKYREAVIGKADDFQDADGQFYLNYRQAIEKVQACEFEGVRRARVFKAGAYTVSQALDDYLEDYIARSNKATYTISANIRKNIRPALGRTVVSRLTTKAIRKWHTSLVKTSSDSEVVRKSRHTANKNLSTLKAALNFAYREERVKEDRAWRLVRPFRNADQPRVRFLAFPEATRLINACEGNFRFLVQAALLTGCRYGELVRMTAGDIQGARIYIPETKSGHPRHAYLTEEGERFFVLHTAGKSAVELIFQRDDGNPWGKSHQNRPMQKACQIAGIKPEISFHILRHTYAAKLAGNGTPLQVIARAIGDSDTRIVERHYAHLAPDYVLDTIQKALPDLGIEMSNVVSLRG